MTRYEAEQCRRSGDWRVMDRRYGFQVGDAYPRRYPTSRRAALRFANRLNEKGD